MTETIRFTVRGEAAAAGSKRAFRNPSNGRMIVTDANPRARPWKALVADAAAEAMAGRAPLEAALAISITFYVARPKGHYGSGKNAARLKPSAPARPTTKPDLLKLARGVEDAMSGKLGLRLGGVVRGYKFGVDVSDVVSDGRWSLQVRRTTK